MSEESTPRAAGDAELEAYLHAHPDSRFVDALFVDLCGVVRGKRYPREDLRKLWQGGLQIARSIYLLDAKGDCPDACGKGFSDGDPDADCFPVPGTLVPVPWAEQARGQVLMTMRDEDGTPSRIEPRNVAAAVLERLRERALVPVVAFELEFYLLDPKRAPDGTPQPPISPVTGERESSTQVYGLAELDGFSGFFEEVEDACRSQCLPASVATKEYAPGQYEVNLRHVGDALAAADHCALLRHLIRQVARRHGVEATFMAKPFLEQTGNGMHVHMSLLDQGGRNVFEEAGQPGDRPGLGSRALRNVIAGMQATLADGMAVFAPNLNGYRRFGPNLFVPVNGSWGANNRSVAFRIPAGPSAARRVEHRVPGADANPYLVLAVLLAGAHHGIASDLDPGPAWQGNACEQVDPDIPMTWEGALARLHGSRVLREYLGADYVDLYCAVKTAERERFLRAITRREYDWYL
jgi:glutamine synthetase